MKKSIYNYFIFTFALLIITTLNEKEVLGLSLSNEHVTKNNYMYSKVQTLQFHLLKMTYI